MNLGDVVELVRAPAALTVPGDALAGGGRSLSLATASACIYWAGMALNDYADREVDARERPERPIPSGRVTPTQAFGLASCLTATGLGLAAMAGRRSLLIAVPLVVTVWTYDLKLKDTPAGPAAMAAARGLDVLLGAGPGAVRAATAVAVHVHGVTALSRGEVHGGSRTPAAGALAATIAAALLAGLPGRHAANNGAVRLAQVGLVLAYLGLVGPAQAQAFRRPEAAAVRAAVGAGILGLLPLQAALNAGRGRPLTAAFLTGLYPLARRLSGRVSPT